MHGERVFTLAARPDAVRIARVEVRRWLESASWPAQLIDDIVYAVSEAVTNTIEHAYRPDEITGTVGLMLRVEHGFDGRRRARVEVSDRGRWRTSPVPRRRGRGLVMMGAFMDELVVHPGEGVGGGTKVVLVSPPVPMVRHQQATSDPFR